MKVLNFCGKEGHFFWSGALNYHRYLKFLLIQQPYRRKVNEILSQLLIYNSIGLQFKDLQCQWFNFSRIQSKRTSPVWDCHHSRCRPRRCGQGKAFLPWQSADARLWRTGRWDCRTVQIRESYKMILDADTRGLQESV